ncbi:MAG: amidase, partial [Wenzhouxiangella sp.]
MSDSLIHLRARLSAGELDVETVVADCLDRIEANNPRLNAFVRIEADGARAAAVESARRYAAGQARALEGLPIAIKDNLDLAGSPTTAGMLTRKHHLADSDAAVVRRLKAAGAIIVGKLHLTEAALGADGANPHFGNCQNPVKLGHSPGGSSSGSAAAVAAGLVPAALGTDTMGSVRIPAAYCGIWGFKPSFGLVSSAGSVAVSRRLDHVGPLTRSAEDLELLLSVMAGFDPDCPVSRPLQLAKPQ